MNKTELAGKIKLLEGLTEDEKSALLSLLHEQKKYGLVWEDKPEDVEQKLEDELPVLKEVKERAIISDDPSAPNHILIEGDNLHALTALTYTHQGKIDVIYIDPPYNTGNKDFKYNDNFVDKEDEYRHSKWLSFMSKRLEISKQLLSEKGVIFISIDDNEQSALKLLCDEIFGEDNSIGPIIQNKQNAKNDTINVQKNHEFILCYRKKARYADDSKATLLPNIILKRKIKKPVIQDENGDFFYLNDAITTRGDGGTLNARSNLGYSIYYHPTSKKFIPVIDYDIEKAKFCNDESEVYITDSKLCDQGYIVIRPPKVRGRLGSWTWDINKFNKDSKNIYIKSTKKGYSVIKRTFVDPNKVTLINDSFFYEEIIYSNSRSIIDFSTNDGTTKFKEIMGNDITFNNPKNVDMLYYLVNISSEINSIILDFFAGSGTTLHATLELNKDGGHRQCILVTNNENNICEEVTYMRSKKVIQGYTTPKGEEIEGLKNNTLRYYRTDFVPREQTNKNKRALMAAATDLLCIKNDVYTEQNTFGGRKLKPNAARYFDNGKTQMLLIYNELAVEAFASMLKEIEVEGKIKIYVFSNNRYAYNDNFENVLDKVELCALPAAIYDAYKKVLKPQKVKENVSQESISEEYVFEKTQGEIDFSEEGGEQ